MKTSLIKENTSLFKLVITPQLQFKIQHTLLRVNNKEWSGPLFYRVEGHTLIAEDFLIMDIGTTASTTFTHTPDIIAYQAEYDLLYHKIGLIHSHHHMKAYFSGTDTNTLEKDGSTTTNFLSLVVNNDRNYCAALATKHNVKAVINKSSTYVDFNGKEKTTKYKGDLENIEIRYAELPIEYPYSIKEIDETIDKLKPTYTQYELPFYESYKFYPTVTTKTTNNPTTNFTKTTTNTTTKTTKTTKTDEVSMLVDAICLELQKILICEREDIAKNLDGFFQMLETQNCKEETIEDIIINAANKLDDILGSTYSISINDYTKLKNKLALAICPSNILTPNAEYIFDHILELLNIW